MTDPCYTVTRVWHSNDEKGLYSGRTHLHCIAASLDVFWTQTPSDTLENMVMETIRTIPGHV
jgi:hypothetical protein